MESARKVRVSYGVWVAMMQFLDRKEQLDMQLCDKFAYEIAIGRVVTYFIFRSRRIPFFHLVKLCNVLAMYDHTLT